MKPRPFFISLAIAAILLLTIAGGSVYWIITQSPLELLTGGVMRQPLGTVFMPKQSPAMISLLVNPDRLESFSQLAVNAKNRRKSHQEFRKIEKSLLAKTGLDYRNEIQPWLGEEITLGVTSLDFDHNASNGTQPGYLLAVETKNAQLTKEFLQVAYSKQAIAGEFDLVFEAYKGINLISQKPLKPLGNQRFLASAVVGNFVLFANDLRVLREAVNNVQVANLNLKNAIAYQEALKTIKDPRIGIAYANFPALSAWLSNLPIPELPEISQGVTVTLSLKAEGLVAQTGLIGVKGEANQSPVLFNPVNALKYTPASSILTLAGTHLTQLWTQIQTDIATDSPLQQFVNRLISQLETPLGLNLSEDIFNWVNGEFSLNLVPKLEGGAADWLFIAEKTEDISEKVAYLDDLAQQQGYSIGKLPLLELDTDVTAWTKLRTTKVTNRKDLAKLDTQVQGVHTETDKYFLFSTSVEAISQALSDSDPSLIDSTRFQQAIRALPSENDGYVYINWPESEPIIEEKFPVIKVAELAIKPFFNNLRSLTLSSQGSENQIRKATFFFNLGVR
ncbi:MAG: DUF3352 domain-containing protein [Microcystaceae cyanobacterium]